MKNLKKILRTHKQWLCVVVLVLVCSGTAFTQQRAGGGGGGGGGGAARAAGGGDKKNAITFVDLIPLFNGFITSDFGASTFFFYLAPSYERLVAPHFGVGVELDLCFGSIMSSGYFYFSLAAPVRYYPMSEKLEKLFIGSFIGINVQATTGGFAGPLIGVDLGYKVLVGNTFFFEPSISYTYLKTAGGPGGGSGGGGGDDDILGGFGGFFDSMMSGISGAFGAPILGGLQAGIRLGVRF